MDINFNEFNESESFGDSSTRSLNLLDLMEECKEPEESPEQGDRPAQGSFALIEYMIQHGELLHPNGDITPAGLHAIMSYIQDGPFNYGSPAGMGDAVRAGYVQDLLNRRYGNMQPFSVQFTPGSTRPDGDHLGVIVTPPFLQIRRGQTLIGSSH